MITNTTMSDARLEELVAGIADLCTGLDASQPVGKADHVRQTPSGQSDHPQEVTEEDDPDLLYGNCQESDEDFEHRQAMAAWFREYLLKGYSPMPGMPDDRRKPYLRKWRRFKKDRPDDKTRWKWLGLYEPRQDDHGVWRRHPAMLKVMILTGSVYRLVVVDVDPRNGGEGTAKSLEFPATYTVTTPRGGLHAYYRLPAGVKVKSAKLKGIDIQAGDLVVAAPSRRSDGHYVANGPLPFVDDLPLAPLWVMDLIVVADGDAEAGPDPSQASRSHDNNRKRTEYSGHFSHPDIGVGRGEQLHQLLHQAGVGHEDRGGPQSVLCPFHQDAEPSLSIDLSAGIWKCFRGCGEGGVVDFLRVMGDRDRVSPTSTPTTPHYSPLLGEVRSPSWFCERPVHGLRPAGTGEVARRGTYPCGRCQDCRRADIRERVQYAHDHWPRGVLRRLIRVPEDQWDALGQRLRHHGEAFIKFPAPDCGLAIVTTMRAGKRISEDFSELEKLIQAVPLKARGEGRSKINVTFSAGLRKPVPKKERGRKNTFRVIQGHQKFDALMTLNGNIIRGSGTNYTFTIPDSPTWESDYGVVPPPPRRMKRPSEHPVPEHLVGPPLDSQSSTNTASAT